MVLYKFNYNNNLINRHDNWNTSYVYTLKRSSQGLKQPTSILGFQNVIISKYSITLHQDTNFTTICQCSKSIFSNEIGCCPFNINTISYRLVENTVPTFFLCNIVSTAPAIQNPCILRPKKVQVFVISTIYVAKYFYNES